MTIDEVVELLNARQKKRITELQEFVLRSSWDGKTYSWMARQAYYGPEYLRKTASVLWSMLSDCWGEPIAKSNFRHAIAQRRLTPDEDRLIENFYRRQNAARSLVYPSGPVSVDSSFYIPRPPIEELADAAIAEPGSLIRIKAPTKMGKSSLMFRILDRATDIGYRSVLLDFQLADTSVFASLNKFLRWFCATLTRKLRLESRLDDYWDEEIGSKMSCTLYVETYLLDRIESPLVLGLNEVNRVFGYPALAQDFFPLLRSWHEQGKQTESWQKLRIIMAYSTEAYIELNLNQSPFNVGLPIQLPPFNVQQIQELARRYQLPQIDAKTLDRFMALVGGHPYLVQLAFYHINRQGTSLEQLLQELLKNSEIYRTHLQNILAMLQERPELATAFKQLVTSDESLELEPKILYQLQNMGLVKLNGDRVTVSCELYRHYFRSQRYLGKYEEENFSLIQKLQKENQQLYRLCYVDELTQLANRRWFDQQIKLEWQNLATQQVFLSLILCDIDWFQAYNDDYGHLAGDFCLQEVARMIQNCMRNSFDLAARYGGEEFAIILPQTDAKDAKIVAENIRERVKALGIAQAKNSVDIPTCVVTVSLGVACTIPEAQSNPLMLISAADEALSRSKQQGRDRVTLFTF